MWPLVAIVAIAYAYRGIYDLKKSKSVRRLTDKGFSYVDRAWDEIDARSDHLDDDALDLYDYDTVDPDDEVRLAGLDPNRITYL